MWLLLLAPEPGELKVLYLCCPSESTQVCFLPTKQLYLSSKTMQETQVLNVVVEDFSGFFAPLSLLGMLVMGVEPRSSHLLVKFSIIEPHPRPAFCF